MRRSDLFAHQFGLGTLDDLLGRRLRSSRTYLGRSAAAQNRALPARFGHIQLRLGFQAARLRPGKLTIADVAPRGQVLPRASVIQQKARRPVPFELTEPAREAIALWLAERGERSDDWLFPSRSSPPACTSVRGSTHGSWTVGVGQIDLPTDAYGTHSLRRTKVALLYSKTGNLRACRLLLGHRKLESTVRYLVIEVDDAPEMSEQVEI